MNDIRSMLDSYFGNLNTHPVPLEFSQSLTTGERLDAMYKIIREDLEKFDVFSKETKELVIGELETKYETLKKQITNEINLKLSNNDIRLKFEELLKKSLANSFKYITFTIEDGYFTAYIPNEWEIHFNTNVDNTNVDYGKLIIEY